MGVLIDFHALPGGANRLARSGTNSSRAELWVRQDYQELAVRCLRFISSQVRTIYGVVGIQIVDEASDAGQKERLYHLYDKILDEICQIDVSMPVYVSDAGDVADMLSWTRRRNSMRSHNNNPLVVETHQSYYWPTANKQKTPQQVIDEVPAVLPPLLDGDVAYFGAAQVVVGEYSCMLRNEDPVAPLAHAFGVAQCTSYQQRAGGQFFWTYCMQNGNPPWSFTAMAAEGSVFPPTHLTFSAIEIQEKLQDAKDQRDQRRREAVVAHELFWLSKLTRDPEDARFTTGWNLGYWDATVFFQMRSLHGLPGADRIGMLDLWCLKRLRECGQVDEFVWEFEHGLRKGVQDLEEAVGIA